MLYFVLGFMFRSISRTDDPEEQETLEGIKRLNQWTSEWETSTHGRCQKANLKEPVLS